MKVTFISKEYPPNIYGGAGVHVKFLTQELAKSMQVEVRCFGEQRQQKGNLTVRGYRTWERMWEGNEAKFNSTLGTFSVDLSIVRDKVDSDLVHTHTWYAAFAGYMAKVLYDIPLICTVHSLEPRRPWKEEQLGRSYRLSMWAERLALRNADRVIAVSNHAREDILRLMDVSPERVEVIHNGIDLELYRPTRTDETRKAFGINSDYILFVGRTSRQKGMVHLIDAVKWVDERVMCVCCTSAPDTKEVEEEIAAKVKKQPRVVWINSLLREEQYVELYSNARVFVCPSVYEPFGIINLESMACETPVVASSVGGILETVVDGETGILVEPANPRALAEAVNRLLSDTALARRFGENGRKRVERDFSWASIAEKTRALYRTVCAEWKRRPQDGPPARG
ncbi:MAG: glycogen synthase [Deltaproteobacteria bacterium]|nr:glycogen synthase [Deltaproteobacteria bacterium]